MRVELWWILWVEQVVLSRAEGNPLFVEEVLRTLIEEGTLARDDGAWRITRAVDVTEIPDTLQGVLTARIDRLDESIKRVVQIAAVVGRVFQRHVLDRVVEDSSILDDCLAQLQIAQIIRERSPETEPEYIFKHILTQEAAYQSLLSQQRRSYHGKVADALARLFWERGEEYAGLVAAHYERAEAWARALRYLQRAITTVVPFKWPTGWVTPSQPSGCRCMSDGGNCWCACLTWKGH
jgi:predicted ATPase